MLNMCVVVDFYAFSSMLENIDELHPCKLVPSTLELCILYLHELEKTGEHDKAEGEYLYHFVATLSFSLCRSVTEGQGLVLKVCV